MEEREESYLSQYSSISGTLSLPAGEGPFPICLLLQDSYSRDRDGDLIPSRDAWMPDAVPKRRFMHQMAEILSGMRIATFRYDKRGCGKSEGEFLNAGLEDYVRDAHEALRHIFSWIPEIDNTHVGVLGYGEGAIVALNLAAGELGLQYCICQSGSSYDLLQEIAKYTEILWEMFTDEWVKELKEELTVLMWSPKRIDEFIEDLRRSEKLMRVDGVTKSIDKYLLAVDEVSQLSPHEFIHKLKIPILFQHGGEFSMAGSQGIRKELTKSGNEKVYLHAFDHLDDYFVEVAENGDTNEMPANQPIDKSMIEKLTQWMDHHQFDVVRD